MKFLKLVSSRNIYILRSPITPFFSSDFYLDTSPFHFITSRRSTRLCLYLDRSLVLLITILLNQFYFLPLFSGSLTASRTWPRFVVRRVQQRGKKMNKIMKRKPEFISFQTKVYKLIIKMVRGYVFSSIICVI